MEIRADVDGLKALGRALKKDADGKALRRDLIRELKKPLVPAVAEIKAGLMSMGAGGLRPGGEALRTAVARRIRPEVKLSGFRAGVRVKARKVPAARGFANAPKRLNSSKGWRHPVFGHRDRWVVQFGRPDYFDAPLRDRRDDFRQAVTEAMEATARRITDNAERG
ncbi:hypothetical protein [Planobispora takensis]|uniref:Uncharacterized protein n=1 Tax=Planobispora takensis TaxID=1367882 RepID=A0A8J3SSH9_9ACTN|nr:hypothetical protein [Planobispora takensis]GIH98091.1 hypothetical protein Pta02_01000 [Planobispora takensis]